MHFETPNQLVQFKTAYKWRSMHYAINCFIAALALSQTRQCPCLLLMNLCLHLQRVRVTCAGTLGCKWGAARVVGSDSPGPELAFALPSDHYPLHLQVLEQLPGALRGAGTLLLPLEHLACVVLNLMALPSCVSLSSSEPVHADPARSASQMRFQSRRTSQHARELFEYLQVMCNGQ